MQQLVYRPSFGPSARKLARLLGVKPVFFNRLRGQACISWGAASSRSQARLNGGICLSKEQHLKMWKESSLQTVQLSHSPVQGWLPRSGSSFGGRDFQDTPSSIAYWTKPILNSTAEYRLHLAIKPGKKRGNPNSYRVIRYGYKTNQDPSLNVTTCGIQIRSRQFGWHLKYYNQSTMEINSSLDLAARWAIAVVGWDFGAIDVLRTRDNKYVILEINSAPGLLDDNTAKAYADALREVIGG